jgi:hypothetical protein
MEANVVYIMRNYVHGYYTTLQLKLKNHSNTTLLQLPHQYCNSYAIITCKYVELINKFPL